MMIAKRGSELRIEGWGIVGEIGGTKISNIRDMKIDTIYRINMIEIMIREKMKIQDIGEQQIQGLIQEGMRLGIGEQIITINIKRMKIWG